MEFSKGKALKLNDIWLDPLVIAETILLGDPWNLCRVIGVDALEIRDTAAS